MLSPDSRVLLTDALRPPTGCRIDVAVGTTYSLDLTALLLAPLSFALFDQETGGDIGSLDPVKLLEAVRRHGEHTTVFCQAGAIQVPANYQQILSFVEGSIHEVVPPTEHAIFHPKIWALRFVDRFGGHRHRLVVLSRNITFDRSWDTALRLDEADDGAIDAAPAAELVRRIPGLCIRDLPEDRVAHVEDLAGTLATSRLAPPEPFTSGELLHVGLGEAPWPFPEKASRVLAISPFLDTSSIHRLGSVAERRDLVSRPETFDRVGGYALAGWTTQVLQRMAEIEVGDDIAGPERAATEWQRSNEGLHAKTYLYDRAGRGGESVMITGSANLTHAGWHGNVELIAKLAGPTRECGVEMTLAGDGGSGGLLPLLEEYTADTDDGEPDPAQATGWELEHFHQALASAQPMIHVTRQEDSYRLLAALDVPVPDPGHTTVRPVSLGAGHESDLGGELAWTVDPTNVTPFLVITTIAGEGDARAERRCVVQVALTGDVDQRRSDNIFSILTSKEDVLRYLVFLLGDPSYDDLFAQVAGAGAGTFAFEGDQSTTIALLEPLIRAVDGDEDALMRVASLMGEIREREGGGDLVPQGFDELWDVVWQVHEEGQS